MNKTQQTLRLYTLHNPAVKYYRVTDDSIKQSIINYNKQYLKGNEDVSIKVLDIEYINKKVNALVGIISSNGATHCFIDSYNPVELINY